MSTLDASMSVDDFAEIMAGEEKANMLRFLKSEFPQGEQNEN
jgi:hypothetical protein